VEKMDTTKIRAVFFVAAIFFGVVVAPVSADWDEGDHYKMHFPQLPDLNGWAVSNYNATSYEPLLLADDWNCTETGYVTDIHIWGSWRGDINGSIVSFNVSIWSNDPGTNFSHPGDLLWQHTFNQSEFTERYWGNGFQRTVWFLSLPTIFIIAKFAEPDHNNTWQYNLHIDPAMAFIQQEGTTYWLALSPLVNNSDYHFGWKTSLNASQDNYVVETLETMQDSNREGIWHSGFESGEALAFVIDGPPQAPEVPLLTPTGLLALVGLLSALAAVTIVRKRR
jgi:hypothetical protein